MFRSVYDFLEWSAVNFKNNFGSKDEEHLTYKINLETIKNKPEILLFRDSFTVRKLATEALENFKEEVKSVEVKTFWKNYPTFMNSLTKVINLTSTRMVSQVSELHDDLSNTIYTEMRNQISSFSKRKKTDSLQNNGKKLYLDQTENSRIMKEMRNTLKENNNIEDNSPDRKKLLSIKEEAEELFNEIDSNTTVELDLSTNITEYLQNLLSGDIKSTLSKIEKPPNDESQLLLWVREVCRHFLLYYYYGGLQVDGGGQRRRFIAYWIYFQLFSRKLYQIMNEAHNDRAYNINYSQKLSNSGCVSKNDAVLYQDKIATILYEQSFGPTEFTLNYQLKDFAKLAHNGVDDLNFHFNQNRNCTTNTAKKFKSIEIHGYKYFLSVYLTDIIRISSREITN
ncbi:36489_t:CDS:2 [Racocetra persica]|uniref:36489_t:CDS:1 n=1 Tax=Racocetra persica TaxID=160502 RepID=A0ACA9KC05_9GLOM|nr:36489_t:CDS:2 [Racocetra persica]